MTKELYGRVFPNDELAEFEPIPLLFPEKGNPLGVSLFGSGDYKKFLEIMQRDFSCLPYYDKVNFRPSTSCESIFVLSKEAEIISPEEKERIKEQGRKMPLCCLGRILQSPDGVFVNPPLDEKGNIDEEEYAKAIDSLSLVNSVLLGRDGFGFAPYESFKTGMQSIDKFCRGGLARVLEGTSEDYAHRFEQAISGDPLEFGVNVECFFDFQSNTTLGGIYLKEEKTSVGNGLGVYDDVKIHLLEPTVSFGTILEREVVGV
ncbi:hypothetical protein HOD75_03075 [archaeon]|jgi:hypothetical protein|nr:hypothetical protein [archaeon]MBT4241856.1 hypothetical protein [archaeon]MBT4418403.1 hypothetical protein [archaeon]